MKISLQWLNDHIDVLDYASRSSEMADLLTSVGLEVEAVEDKTLQFKNVVVGHIVKLDRHPNADRLTVCQVDTGDGQPRQIVCGAKNHKAGDKVVVALPGAVLPGDFEIKKSKIRDVESLGMLASESELGLKKESEGILILPAEAPVGTSFAEYGGLNDVIFELKITPNRADCLSHLGLARELSCLLGRPLKSPVAKFKSSSSVVTRKAVGLEVRDTKLCPRYSGRLIKAIKVGPSPSWLKTRVESVGLNSINNVVDVTNFVMMDVGQPLHAFDLAHLKGSKVIVDRATVGEKFKTLDGTELTLTGDELTIRDQERAVCLAGVVGGLNSGVTEGTQDLFIESAHFAMDSVRRTARRHGLQTDSAYRFSRGTDPSGVIGALDRACALIQQVAGGEVAADHWDEYPAPASRKPIAISAAYVSQRLGYSVDEAEMVSVFQRLGCKVVRTAVGGSMEFNLKGSEVYGADEIVYHVTPPEFRMDLEQDVDLVEEFGRLKGYDKIPETLPVFSYAPLSYDKGFVFEQRVAELARSAGLSQAVNYGFTASKFQSEVLGAVEAYRGAGLDMDSHAVALKNPLSEDLDVMRVSLLPGLLRNCLHNIRHGNNEGRLFEEGFAFRRGPEGYQQDARLGFIAWGSHAGLWQKAGDESAVFFDLKARLQYIFDKLLISQVQWTPWNNTPQLVHPSQAATIFIEGRNIGFIGALHPSWAMKEKLRVGVALGEIDLKALMRGQPRSVKFKPVSKFPAVERDIAFVVPKEMRAQDVAAEIKRTAGALLQSIEVFDVFQGGNLPADHQSVAYRMIYQDLQETLTEERLSQLQSQIVANVEKKLSVKVR
ncbi:MAG: phenylalanine--tRNA ligase subunit beta [Bdellovibrionales bacterium]|nr:phenylalanine--tRNA ligase subunit beta [Bdellovibrionales bacterium]